MENDTEVVQRLFDEISESEGMPKIDLSEDDSDTLPFGDGMLLHIHYRSNIPEIVFTAPLGGVPADKKAEVFEQLLAANFYWVDTHGATLSYQSELQQVVIQFQEKTSSLTAGRLKAVMEGFIAVAMKWKDTLGELVADAEGGDGGAEVDIVKKAERDMSLVFNA